MVCFNRTGLTARQAKLRAKNLERELKEARRQRELDRAREEQRNRRRLDEEERIFLRKVSGQQPCLGPH
jgi:hypothetical protein